MWPPGASWQVAMPQVGLTWGWLAGGDVRGEPHPPARLGYFIYYITLSVCVQIAVYRLCPNRGGE